MFWSMMLMIMIVIVIIFGVITVIAITISNNCPLLPMLSLLTFVNVCVFSFFLFLKFVYQVRALLHLPLALQRCKWTTCCTNEFPNRQELHKWQCLINKRPLIGFEIRWYSPQDSTTAASSMSLRWESSHLSSIQGMIWSPEHLKRWLELYQLIALQMGQWSTAYKRPNQKERVMLGQVFLRDSWWVIYSDHISVFH